MQQPQPEQEDQGLYLSHWAEYKREMYGLKVLERPYGFISYKLDGEIIHIVDVFIPSSLRNGNTRRVLFDEVVKIAKENGAAQALGQVDVLLNGATRRLSFWLTMGASVFKADRNVIYFVKRL